MELLNRRRRARPALAALALLASLFASGCLLLERLAGADRALAFSHAIHVEQEGLSCENCHEDAYVSDEPGMPYLDTCLFCHEDMDAELPRERRIESLFEEDVYVAAHVSRLGPEPIFSHAHHVDLGIECSECHADIEGNERVTSALALRMDDCTACHTERDAPNECATCHTEHSVDRTPASHGPLWIEHHGTVCRRDDPATVHDCSMCHSEHDCSDCHQVWAPKSHTSFWRIRGHGIEARMDRESCATCHQTYDCDRCHQETLPLSHRGPWGGTQSMHCVSCHLPLGQNGCVTCHKSTTSHDLATPKPAWHTPAMNCRACHGVSQPLPHVDNGDNCNLCHH